MQTPDRIGLFRTAAAALLLVSAARSQAFPDRVHSAAPPPSDSDGAYCAVARWGGRLFILRDAACFWTSDGGATWKRAEFARMGPKGRTPALEGGWFTLASNGLWLGNREGALAWRFDPAAGSWPAWPEGAGILAAAGDGDRLYALSPGGRLRATGNAGVTWAEIPLPAAVRDVGYFDEILAEGENLVLRMREPGNLHPAAVSLDGGAAWALLEPRSLPLLAHGRLYAFSDSLRVAGRGGPRSLAAPPGAVRAAFADPGGALFAWSGSALYALGAEEGASWSLYADTGEMRAWTAGRGALLRAREAGLSWFDGSPSPTAGLRRTSARRPAALSPRGRFPGPAFGHGGKRHSALGRRLPGPTPVPGGT